MNRMTLFSLRHRGGDAVSYTHLDVYKRQDEFLAEMRHEVFDGREGFLTVGEAPGITPARNEHITDPENGELDMLFLFEHLDADCEDNTKWKPTKLELPKLKEILNGQQNAVSKAGWASQMCIRDRS